jgi:hypothetical protein
MNIIDEIVQEWGYKVPNGIIDVQNPYHVVLLEGVLDNYHLTREQKTSMLNALRKIQEVDLVKNKKTGNTYDVQKHNPDTQDLVKKNASNQDIEKVNQDDEEPQQDEKPFQPSKEDIMNMLKNMDLDADQLRKLYNRTQNFTTYRPIKDTLNQKGYHPKILKKFSKEIQDLVEDLDGEETAKFTEYLSDSERQTDFPSEREGNIQQALEKTGVPKSVVGKILTHTSQDEGKKGVGMGEVGMSLLFKNVKGSKGKGDLAVINPDGSEREFELKGDNATLGLKPDDFPASTQSLEALGGIEVGKLTIDNKPKEGLIYNGKVYAKNKLADVLSTHYKTLNDEQKEQFHTNFKQMILKDVLKAPRDVMDSSLYDQFISTEELKPDFNDPKSINDTVGLLNFVNYATLEGFEDFMSHDFGATKTTKTGKVASGSAPNKGNYVYANGTPLEMAQQLKGKIHFQRITNRNLRPRVGHGTSHV